MTPLLRKFIFPLGKIFYILGSEFGNLNMKQALVFTALFISCFFVSSCATVPTDPAARAVYEANNDPLEPLNRQIFTFNLRADKYVMRPVINGYRAVTTPNFRKNIRTFFANLKTPLTVVNDLLQLNFANAGLALSRFTINSTLGFFGFFDVADRLGIAPHTESFANTLGYWGVPSGPYLMLPLLGPSSIRDASGMVTDIFLDPITYVSAANGEDTLFAISIGVDGLEAIVQYENIVDLMDDARKNSLDFYAYMRTMYQQHRKAAIQELRGGSEDNQKASYEFSFDEEEDWE